MTLFDDLAGPDGPSAEGATGAGPRPEPRRLSLVRLSGLIAQAAGTIGRVSVEGEVHRATTRTGRQWFTLRDRASQISVSVPATRRSRCRVVDGERVCVTGRLEWVASVGALQLVADEVVPVGEGAIAAQIAEARRRLDADGLLTRPRRPIPVLPRVIGVVCGREAAVRADIESVVAARFPGYPIVFLETTVSGPSAVDAIVEAIADLDRRPDIDVIILARGGGDATQLLPFSDEAVCRAACGAETPVVAAIGHDGDRPLVDEVADLRCGTPSLAAGAVVPDRATLEAAAGALLAAAAGVMVDRVRRAGDRLAASDRRGAAMAGLDRAGERLVRAAAQRALVHPVRELTAAEVRLARIDVRGPAVSRLVEARRTLVASRSHADALSPQRVLERGYAVVRRAGDGTVVRSPVDTGPGTRLAVTLAGGVLSAVAGEVGP